MSLTHSEFVSLTSELQLKLTQASFLDSFQEGEWKIYLAFKTTEGESATLLLCLQERFLRFNLLSRKVIKHHQGNFSRQLFFYLRGSKLIQIAQLAKDRILELTFENQNKQFYLIGEFFPKRPNLFLTDEKRRILASCNKNLLEYYQKPKEYLRNYAESQVSHAEIEKKYQKLESEAFFQKEKNHLMREVKERYKRCTRTLTKSVIEVGHLSDWSKVQHEAELLQANLYRIQKGMNTITVQDWLLEGKEVEIAIDNHLTPGEIVGALFKKAKKMHAGIERCQALISRMKEMQKNLEDCQQNIEKASNIDELQHIRQLWNIYSPEKPLQNISQPFREFSSESGLKIWVGKGASENEKLTFSLARGSDFWMHVRDFPGSHVVIRVSKGKRPDEQTIKDAAQLALAYSKGKNQGIVDLILTQCKFISRSRNKKGLVFISSKEVFQDQFDSVRFQKIKQRQSGSNL